MFKNLHKNLIITITVIAIIVFAIGGFVWWWVIRDWNSGEIVADGFYSGENSGNIADGFYNNENKSNIPDDNTIENIERQNSYIFIHITGEVVNPGVVKITEGERIINAIEQAGGITSNADLSKINLAYVLEDGNMVIVPAYGESNENFKCVISGSGECTDTNLLNSSNSNIRLSTNKVNINTANQTELETLPGIGPSLAMRIISYRKQNGNFITIEDLKNVSGIGESKFGELKNLVTVK